MVGTRPWSPLGGVPRMVRRRDVTDSDPDEWPAIYRPEGIVRARANRGSRGR